LAANARMSFFLFIKNSRIRGINILKLAVNLYIVSAL
jgi:hypothetical protein